MRTGVTEVIALLQSDPDGETICSAAAEGAGVAEIFSLLFEAFNQRKMSIISSDTLRWNHRHTERTLWSRYDPL
jgi:hypothetical protein